MVKRAFKSAIKTTLCLLAIASIFFSNISIVSGNKQNNKEFFNEPKQNNYPNGYTHRPIIEFFTSLSCSYCQKYGDPAMSKLWEENGYTKEQPFTYVAFHQTNGGAHDDPLVTDESRERYNYYVIPGTPDAEFDGGYIQESGADENAYENYKKDTEDSGNRDVKPVDLYITQMFNGNGFAVNVSIYYPGDGGIHIPGIAPDELHGSLYVFMIEDNVISYSSYLEKKVLNHNVFRGYAIKDEEFTIERDNWYNTTAVWKIPEAKIPIKPMDVMAIGAIYDRDDTTSQRDGDGNKANTPRAIQSSTPISTSYDIENEPPKITEIEPKFENIVNISFQISDDDKIQRAYLFYNTQNESSQNWTIAEMTLTGECDDSETCSLYGDGIAYANIDIKRGETIYFVLLAYDGKWMQAKTEIYNYIVESSNSSSSSSSNSKEVLAVGVVIGAIVIGVAIIARKRKRSRV